MGAVESGGAVGLPHKASIIRLHSQSSHQTPSRGKHLQTLAGLHECLESGDSLQAIFLRLYPSSGLYYTNAVISFSFILSPFFL